MDLFLRPELPTELTSSLLYYALLDIINVQQMSSSKNINQREFDKFSTIVNMNPALSNYICGCWFLDNGFGKVGCHGSVTVGFLGKFCLFFLPNFGEKLQNMAKNWRNLVKFESSQEYCVPHCSYIGYFNAQQKNVKKIFPTF